MSPQMCRDARGIMLAAAPRATFERAREALSKMTGELVYVGERRDLAAAYKLFGNAMIVTLTAGLADVFAMASSLGIPAVDAQQLFTKFNPANVLTYRGSSMAKGNYQASFELTMARKDVRLMLEAAAPKSDALVALPAIAAKMDALIASGHGHDDLGVLSIESVPRR
jgi:3-hydroxyisobutyrate dehydrogenase-like beta-hydroxyacid dehydrogenase